GIGGLSRHADPATDRARGHRASARDAVRRAYRRGGRRAGRRARRADRMSAFVETHGAGPDLVLVHGWGLHGGLFGPLVPLLAERRRVHVVDLPGHGRSATV